MDFRSAYNREEYIRFFRQLFGEEKFIKKDRSVNTHIPEKGYFKNIHTLWLVSDLDGLDEDLVILEIEHTSSRDARVALTKELMKLLSNSEIEAMYHTQALVIFTNREDSTYRLSLFTTTYDRTQGVKKILSNPRRQSFLLWQKKIHTASKQLSKKVIDFSDLKKRFSIESVNKDFYTQIAEFFYELTGGTFKKWKVLVERIPAIQYPSIYPEKSKNETERKEFWVRLIGRLMFCWFLKQKIVKDSIGLIPSSVLSSDAINGPDYYNEFLETLFFEVLNMPPESRTERAKKAPWSDIPYLNGGLFHPHDNDYYESKKWSVHVPNDWLLRFFEFLELYNFTIDENTTVDQDMSVDPEMLGRIFENLLAEINPETGESARKSTGSFYTPREIVEYMVDEALIQYFLSKTHISEDKIRAVVSYDLDDDINYPLSELEKKDILNSLQTLTIFDPACWSGAYPLGILQKILYILQTIDTDGSLWINMKLDTISDPLLREHMKQSFTHKNTDYLRKLTIIRDTIFWCDIQPIAVETSKLRCFLTLIVDEQIDVNSKNFGIEPLPNLEFKFVCANTLIPLNLSETEKKDINHNVRYKHVLQSQINLNLDEQRDIIEELKNIRSIYFSSHHDEKNSIKRRAKELQWRLHSLSIQSLTDQSIDDAYAYEIGKLNDWDIFGSKSTGFFDKSWMFWIDEGFDIVIWNPPYVRIQNIESNTANKYKKMYNTAMWKYDIYILFYQLWFSLLKEGGNLCFITSNSFLYQQYWKKLIAHLFDNRYVKKIVDFYHNQIFENASIYTLILLWSRSSNTQIEYTRILHKKDFTIKDIQFKNMQRYETFNYRSLMLDSLATKITWDNEIISKYFDTKSPLFTGNDEILFFENSNDITNDAIWKTIIKPEDVKRYSSSIPKGKIFFPYDINWEKFKLIDEWSFLNSYSKTYNYLLPKKDILLKRKDSWRTFFEMWRMWYSLMRTGIPKDFIWAKIITASVVKDMSFTIDESNNLYPTGGIYALIPKNHSQSIYFVCWLLNSSIAKYYFHQKSAAKRWWYIALSADDLKNFPLPKINFTSISKIEILVKKIIQNKKNNQDIDNVNIEREIDVLVFCLYGLTVEEISVVAPDMVLTDDEIKIIEGK